MEDFDNAQKLFGSFQKHGKFSDLRESLDILETLIGHQGIESKRASNLRKIISDHIDSELKKAMVPGIGNSVFGRKFGQGEEKKIPCFRCLTLR
jgi:hypothetical protein